MNEPLTLNRLMIVAAVGAAKAFVGLLLGSAILLVFALAGGVVVLILLTIASFTCCCSVFVPKIRAMNASTSEKPLLTTPAALEPSRHRADDLKTIAADQDCVVPFVVPCDLLRPRDNIMERPIASRLLQSGNSGPSNRT